jgi:zinc protease
MPVWVLGGPSGAAAAYLWFNVGASDEPPGMEGAAHVVEHMAFKGTKRFGVGEIARAVEDAGGDINAWTSFDETVFHVTIPSPDIGVALDVLAEMGRHARFDPNELRQERKVILEEIRGCKDEPEQVVAEALYAEMFPGHPYGRPVIGSVRTVRAMTADALVAFYARHYVPANACLVVAGDVDPAEVGARARTLFSGGGPRPARTTGAAAPSQPGFRVLRRGFETRLAELGFAAPAWGHADMAALELLCSALGGGPASVLDRRVRQHEPACLEASIGYDAEKHGGAVVASIRAAEGGLESALAAVRAELARVATDGMDEADVERARAQVLGERVFARQTVDGRASQACFESERMGHVDGGAAYEARLRAATVADVNAAAARWLRDCRAVVLAPARERARPVAVAPRAGEVRPSPVPVRRSSPPSSRGPIERILLANGLRLLLEADGGEVLALRAVGLGGQLAERRSTCGRAAAWSRVVTHGAAGRDAATFAGEVDRHGGALGATAGRSSQALRGEFPAEFGESGLDLFLDTLLAPGFPEDELDRVRTELLDDIATLDDDPDGRLMDRLWAMAAPRHPWGLASLGSAAGVRALTPRSLAVLHARWRAPTNLVISVSGGFDRDRVERKLRERLGALANPWVHPCPAPLPPARPPRHGTVRGGREQAHLAVAWPGVAVASADAPAMALLTAVLGGQGGPLFRDLRERTGLAYAVGISSVEGVHPGLVVASLATDPRRVREAERALQAAIPAALEREFTDSAVERARRGLLASAVLDLQTASARASAAAWGERYGLDGLAYRHHARRVEGVSADAVRALAARTFRQAVAVVRVLPR